MLIKLQEYVLICNKFTFNEDFFRQLYGTAIGVKVSPSYANLVVSTFETFHVYSYQLQPLCYFASCTIYSANEVWTQKNRRIFEFESGYIKIHIGVLNRGNIIP